jgi:hypothetical protein
MEKISKREFSLNINKYLKKGSFIITFRGKDQLKITVEDCLTKPDVQWTQDRNQYGCGCKRDTSLMCPKHNRI